MIYGDEEAVHITIFLNADRLGAFGQHRADNIVPLSTKLGDDREFNKAIMAQYLGDTGLGGLQFGTGSFVSVSQ